MRTTLLFKALADDTRLRTFRILTEASAALCVAELADILRKPQYSVSRSVIELRKAGLVDEDRQGKFVYYNIKKDLPLKDLGLWIIQNCQCDEEEFPQNHDGSSPPGGPGCRYDSERLRWRLALRDPSSPPLTRPKDDEAQDPRPRVLFICVHNSARSQLAEEYLRLLGGEHFRVESAGLSAGTLNPHVVAVLQEQGIEISQKKTQAVGDLFQRGETYDWVITVCSREAEENCPVFPGPIRRLSWPFPDPSGWTGTEDEVRNRVRELAAQMKNQVKTFMEENLTKEEI